MGDVLHAEGHVAGGGERGPIGDEGVVEFGDRQARGHDDDGARRQAAASVGVAAGQFQLAVTDRGDTVPQDQLDTGFEQTRLDEGLFVAEDGPGRDRAGGDYHGDAEVATPQLLGDDAAHVAVIVVVDDDRAGDGGAGEDVVGREDVRAL